MKQVFLSRLFLWLVVMALGGISILLSANGYFFTALVFLGILICIGIWDIFSLNR